MTSRTRGIQNTKLLIDALAKNMPIAAFDAATSGAFDTICYGTLVTPKGRGSLDWYSGPVDKPEAKMSEPDMIDMAYALGDAIRNGMTVIGWGTTMFDFRIMYCECRAKDEIAFVAANHIDLQLYAIYVSGLLPSLYHTATANGRLVHLEGAAPDMKIPGLWRKGGRGRVKSVVLSLLSNAAMTINLFARGTKRICNDSAWIDHTLTHKDWKRTGSFLDSFMDLIEDENDAVFRKVHRNCRWLSDHAGDGGTLRLLSERRRSKDDDDGNKETWLDLLAKKFPDGVPRNGIPFQIAPH